MSRTLCTLECKRSFFFSKIKASFTRTNFHLGKYHILSEIGLVPVTISLQKLLRFNGSHLPSIRKQINFRIFSIKRNMSLQTISIFLTNQYQ